VLLEIITSVKVRLVNLANRPAQNVHNLEIQVVLSVLMAITWIQAAV